MQNPNLRYFPTEMSSITVLGIVQSTAQCAGHGLPHHRRGRAQRHGHIRERGHAVDRQRCDGSRNPSAHVGPRANGCGRITLFSIATVYAMSRHVKMRTSSPGLTAKCRLSFGVLSLDHQLSSVYQIKALHAVLDRRLSVDVRRISTPTTTSGTAAGPHWRSQ